MTTLRTNKVKRLNCSKCGKHIGYGTKATKVSCIQCFSGKKTPKKQITASSSYAKTKKGKRADLGEDVFKSSYEANTARWLKLNGVQYIYEEKAFLFNKELLQKGPFLYTPDFFLKSPLKGHESKTIIEVKGYFDPSSRAKIRRLKKYYPEEFKQLLIIANKKDKKVIEFCNKMHLTLIPYEQVLEDLKEAGVHYE